MTDRKTLMNAFQPATELSDPERFAGRSKQVRELTDSLHSIGATPLIFGDRGLGKSSLALQLQLIAMGNPELLHQLNAERLQLGPEELFITFYVTCTDATKTFPDLLQSLINAAESVDNSPTDEKASELVDRSTRRKLTIKILELESTKKYQTQAQRLSYQELNLEEKLVQLCDLLTATYGHPVMFIVDEVDRMSDTQGMASFLKAASSASLKFTLVGIASNVADLLADHQSLERRLQPIRVPLMTHSELGQVVKKAERYLSEEGINVTFSERAVAHLVRVAAGFPWFVHVLGQQALIDADGESRVLVDDSHVKDAIGRVSENRFAQQFSDMYQKAVRDSENRERTLRTFAMWDDPDIPTGEMYSILRRQGVKGGSTYRAHLCTSEYGSVLFVPPIQKRGLVRFRNEMFKAYVRMRSSLYEGVDMAVISAYRQRDADI